MKENSFWKGCLSERCEIPGVGSPIGITDGGCCYSRCGLNRSLTEMEPIGVSVEVIEDIDHQVRGGGGGGGADLLSSSGYQP